MQTSSWFKRPAKAHHLNTQTAQHKARYMCVYLCGGDVADVLGGQLFEQRGLPPVVQTQQQNPDLLVWCAL